MDRLINEKYKYMADILYKDGKLRKEFSVLINGSNVLLLPEKFNTILNDGDEIIMTVQITGG